MEAFHLIVLLNVFTVAFNWRLSSRVWSAICHDWKGFWYFAANVFRNSISVLFWSLSASQTLFHSATRDQLLNCCVNIYLKNRWFSSVWTLLRNIAEWAFNWGMKYTFVTDEKEYECYEELSTWFADSQVRHKTLYPVLTLPSRLMCYRFIYINMVLANASTSMLLVRKYMTFCMHVFSCARAWFMTFIWLIYRVYSKIYLKHTHARTHTQTHIYNDI